MVKNKSIYKLVLKSYKTVSVYFRAYASFISEIV